MLLAGLAVTLGAGGGALAFLREPLPEAPAQPIRFSHRIHAGDATIGCLSCHVHAERAPVAGIPSMARCRGCHRLIKEDRDSPTITAEIQALLVALDQDRPIAWVRVHRVPDHVYFTHARHVRAAIACRECHGAVETMDVVRQVAPLDMGWCVACHRRSQAENPVGRAHLTECVTCHK